MNKSLLNKLRLQGYTYLYRKHGNIAFKAIKYRPTSISDTPLMEDELISMDDAIAYAHTTKFRNQMIILK